MKKGKYTPCISPIALVIAANVVVSQGAFAQSEARVVTHASTGSGFQRSTSTSTLAGFSDAQRWLSGDFDGDGTDDLVNVYGARQADGSLRARAWLHLSDGDGFEYRSGFSTLAGFSNDQRWLVGDFDADGMDDLVNVYGRAQPDGSVQARAWIHLSTGSGFEYRSGFSALAGFSDDQRWIVGDFDGDGLDDLVNVYGRAQPDGSVQARAWVHRSQGAGFEYRSSFTTFAGFWDGQRWLAGDYDNDGMDDLVNVYGRRQPDGSIQARAWRHLSTGAGFELQSSIQSFAGFWDAQRWLVGDFDGSKRNVGEGRGDDLVNVYGRSGADGTVQARAWRHQSNGNRFDRQSGITTLPDFSDDQRWIVGDFDGDGLDDLATVSGSPLPELPPLTATSAIVIDRASGRLLGAERPETRLPIASTTKIMTALLVIEAIGRGEVSLNDRVTVGAGNDAASVGGTCASTPGTSMPCGQGSGLALGDSLSVQDLLFALMLPSANAAANTLAAFVGGDVRSFVDRMNQRADQLGLSDTNFVTPHGRDPEDLFGQCNGFEPDKPRCAHYSTARDLARLARTALSLPLFAQLVQTESYVTGTWIDGSGLPKNILLCNTNRLVRRGSGGCRARSEVYPQAYGVKTGTTQVAGSCLVSAARMSIEGGATVDVIAVVLGSNQNGTASGDRYSDSAALLDFGLFRATGTTSSSPIEDVTVVLPSAGTLTASEATTDDPATVEVTPTLVQRPVRTGPTLRP